MNRPARRDGGFTLIEILLAIGVLMLGATGALGVFVIASDSHRLAIDQADAALAAQSLVNDYERLCRRNALERLPCRISDLQCPDFPQFYYDLSIVGLQKGGDPETVLLLDDAAELLVTLSLKHNKGQDRKAYIFETVFLLRPF